MKNRITLLLVLIISTSLSAQTKLVKTLSPEKCPKVQVKIPNNLIEHEAWDEGEVRLDIVIKVNLPDAVLKLLVKAGRYELLGKKVEEDYFLSAPNMNIPLSVEEKTIKEIVSIKIRTPEYIVMNTEGILYKDIDEELVCGTSRSYTREEMEAVLKRMKEIREDLKVHVSVVSVVKNQAVDLTNFSLNVGHNKVSVEALIFPAVE